MKYTLATLLVLGCLGSAAPVLANADTASLYLTEQGSDKRLAPVGQLKLTPLPQPSEKQECVYVDASKTFQSLLGIGGAITDASAETYDKLPEERRKEVLKAYFDAKDGIGYSLIRTHISGCDFSSASYDYVTANDTSLSSFSIAPDMKHRIPLTKAALALAGKEMTVFASPWSPPAWMKTNNDVLHGGSLKPEHRATWANYIAKFIKAYETVGIPIWGLTVQNEPMAVQKWESCVFTAEEERDFIKENLGPTLAKQGLGSKKIIIWDHNRTMMYHRAQVILDDPAAAKYVWGLGYHWYVNDSFDNVKRVAEAYPKTHLMMTEGCNGPYETAGLSSWKLGETYGASLIADLNNGAEGWCDWNILLDEQGGPNHVANYCFAPIHGDTRTGALTYTNAYYYIGHFSKFIRPGAKRIISSTTLDTLKSTAFRNADGSIAVVVMNATDKEQKFNLWLEGKAGETSLPAHSIMTLQVGK